jgi:hypothetical protein
MMSESLEELRLQYISMCANLGYIDDLIQKQRDSLQLLESMRSNYSRGVQELAERITIMEIESL